MSSPRHLTTLSIGVAWNRIPQGPHRKRLLGCLLVMGVVGCGGASVSSAMIDTSSGVGDNL